MEIKIIKITAIYNRGGLDKISLYTELPNPYADNSYNDVPVILNFDATNAMNYCRKHFPDVPVEFIDARPKRTYPPSPPTCGCGRIAKSLTFFADQKYGLCDDDNCH